MAATPPLQVLNSPTTPLTPLHGAAYERKPTRQSSRIKQQLTAPSAAVHALRAVTPEAETPRPRRRRQSHTDQDHHTVAVTPRKPKASFAARAQSPPQTTPRRASRRLLHIIPPSPNADEMSPPRKPSNRAPRSQPFLSSTTTVMSEGMLPTPIKTPSKKKKAAAAHTAAAAAVAGRVLFQDQLGDAERDQPVTVTAPSPRRTRKNKRYNGFSLESFAAAADADDEAGLDGTGIQIFTDNRDKVPEPDTDKANPFIDQPESESATTRAGARARKPTASGSRTKTRRERRLDPQVEQAIRDDDGMVCVFRGKKVYRRFNDAFEEEEEIDDLDLGLLEHTDEASRRTRPLKTLTRKSIKPTPAASARLDAKAKISPFDAWPRVKPGTRSVSTAKKRSANEAELSDDDNDDPVRQN
ncbi:hypothetical protein DV738_g2360, partial [Chaetothyriales sp. CBS 135597]